MYRQVAATLTKRKNNQKSCRKYFIGLESYQTIAVCSLSDRGFCLTAKTYIHPPAFTTKIWNPSVLLRVCVYSQLRLEYNDATPNSKQLLFPRLPRAWTLPNAANH